MTDVDVIIDQRESRSDMFQLFREHDDVDDVQTEMLDIGDIIANGEIVFERKSKGDFVQSIQNQRLETQIEKMYDVFGPEKSYVLVEADMDAFEYLPYSHFSPASVYGFVGSISARWQMVPLFTSDSEHLVDLVTRIARKHDEDTERVVRGPNDTPTSKNDDFFGRAVLQFSGVGKSKIEPLRDEFGTFEELTNTTQPRLERIPGIGSETAKTIMEELGIDD